MYRALYVVIYVLYTTVVPYLATGTDNYCFGISVLLIQIRVKTK